MTPPKAKGYILAETPRNPRDIRRLTTPVFRLCRSPELTGILGRGNSHNYVA